MPAVLTKAAIKASSKNALKSGIYANTLLEGEDPQELQNTIDGLVQDFKVTTTIGYQLAQELAQVMLRMRRAERWRATLISAHLAKHSTRVEFSNQLNLCVLGTSALPFGISTTHKLIEAVLKAFTTLIRSCTFSSKTTVLIA